MATVVTAGPQAAWLRNRWFDLGFVVGIPVLALSTGALVTLRPELFILVFTVDMWLLGYHHVAATFTRLCLDSESFREHRALVLYLPLAVAAAVFAVVAGLGVWVIVTVYLYWQWWHYTRQSEGIAKAYAARNRERSCGDRRLGRLAFYAVPIAGIVTLSSREPATYLFLPIRTLPVPAPVVLAVQFLAAVAVLLWLGEQHRLWREGRLATTYTAYLLTHFLIYAVAYIGFEDPTRGWLVINMWHNTQYIAFVWMFNNRRFASGTNPRHILLSTISQTRNWWLYLLTCVTLSLTFYYSMEAAISLLGVSGIAYAAAFYQSVNFHHYIVDSKIWKLRKPPIRSTLGIT